jgi:hypothetical protein
MRNFYSLMVALLTSSIAFAQYNVTFQVDLGAITPSANGVHVAGDFQMAAGAAGNWDPAATSMTNSSGTVYDVQVSLPAGTYQFKFINDNDWPGVESVPAAVQVDRGSGNDNRWFTVRGDTVLAAVMFGGAAPAGMHALTTVVDMSQETNVDDTISVTGNSHVPNWTPGASIMTDLNSDSVYSHIEYIMSGTMVEFKFINGAAWGSDESVPGSCAVNGNRGITVNSDTVYNNGAVCFGQCMSCFIPDTFNVTVNVDMQNLCGWTSDSADIAGPLNSWSGGDYLTDPDGDNIYSITVRVPGPEFKYKARSIQNGNTSWEGGADKTVQLTSDTVLMVRCFGADAFGACTPKPAPGDLRFVVDMTTFPNPADLNDVYVIGDFTTPNWQDGRTLMNPVPGAPGVFETTFTGICPGKVAYKFMNVKSDGTEQEEDWVGLMDSSCTEPSGTGSLNRFFERPDDQLHILAFKWNSCEALSISLNENFSNQTIDVYPNPFNGSTTITLDENELFDLAIKDISGKEVYKSSNVSGKYTISADHLSEGIYLLEVTNNRGETNINKVVVQ